MLLSYVISTQPTRFAAVSLADATRFQATVARLAELGYDGVELAVRDPTTLDVPSVQKILEANHLHCPALGTGQAYVEEGLSFTDPDASVRTRAIARIEAHIALASQFNTLVIIGLIRGTMRPPTPHNEAHAWLLDAIRTLARAAGAHNVRLAIEPINRYETNLLNTVTETLALINEVGVDNLGVLFDTFHANIEEPSIEDSLRACGSHLFHVHVADSNRWAPGFGHTDFTRIFAALREMKYNGWVSAEILQKPDAEQAMQMTIKTARTLDLKS